MRRRKSAAGSHREGGHNRPRARNCPVRWCNGAAAMTNKDAEVLYRWIIALALCYRLALSVGANTICPCSVGTASTVGPRPVAQCWLGLLLCSGFERSVPFSRCGNVPMRSSSRSRRSNPFRLPGDAFLQTVGAQIGGEPDLVCRRVDELRHRTFAAVQLFMGLGECRRAGE